MSFPSDKNSATGMNKKFGNPVPADERSNKGPTAGSKTIGTIKGRYTFSKQSVTSLNTGDAGNRPSAKTSIPGKAP